MRQRVLVKVIAAVGLACALGVGWALGSSRAGGVQELQPTVEIPLYAGAQVEWEVRLTAQELGVQLAQWAQELSVLRTAGYRIEGGRAAEVLSFYDQALAGWRRIAWTRPSEGGGVRLFVKDQLSSMLVLVSSRYAATDLIVVTAHVVSELEAPIFEGAELQWELLLTKDDLLELLKQWFKELSTIPSTMTFRLAPPAEMWLVWLGVDTIQRLLRDFSELTIVGYRVEGAKALDVLTFYEQQFSGWRRNLWINPEEYGSIRVFTRSDAQGLQALSAVATMSFGWNGYTTVIVLWARR